MEQMNHTFTYTYSAPRQEELRRIREKYLPREEDKMEKLLRLDRMATNKGMMASLVAGVPGALVLGLGMSCAMVWNMYVLGCVVGIVGMAGVAAAYPLYNRVLKREREKNAPEILRLTEELMNNA